MNSALRCLQIRSAVSGDGGSASTSIGLFALCEEVERARLVEPLPEAVGLGTDKVVGAGLEVDAAGGFRDVHLDVLAKFIGRWVATLCAPESTGSTVRFDVAERAGAGTGAAAFASCAFGLTAPATFVATFFNVVGCADALLTLRLREDERERARKSTSFTLLSLSSLR